MEPPPGTLRERLDEATIFVVDDDALALRIIVQTLRSAGHAAEAFDDPRAFLASAPFRRHGCAILDMRMPDVSGLVLQRAMKESGATLPVIFLTGSADVRTSVEAMKGGAVDFLLKPADREEMLAAVARAVERSAQARAARAEGERDRARLSRLTLREREVCELVARGMLNKQIALDLGMSEATVKIHRGRVMDKLQVGSAAELAAMMERLRHG